MPVLDEHSLDFLSHSPEQTLRYGERLGEQLDARDVISLSGDLGSGKTTLVAGLGRGWGALEPVTSPTFVLVNEYRRADGQAFWHLDCYRLRSGAEALALGLDDLLDAGGVLAIEWPEHILEALPAERLEVHLRWMDDTKRGLRLEAHGARYQRLVKEFRKIVFGN